MKTLFLALLITLVSPLLFAQRMVLKETKETWLPESYMSLSTQEQRFISNLNSVGEKNKQFVQLIFDAGNFSNCGVGTALRSNKLFVSVVDKENSAKHSYVIDFKKALVNDSPFVSDNRATLHVVVFEQNTQVGKQQIPQTILVYFYYSAAGDMEGMQIFVKKKEILSRANPSPQIKTSYQITCNSK